MRIQFYIDQKETIWRRNHCEVEVETEEEAIEIMKRLAKNHKYDYMETNYSFDSEILFETSEDLTFEENGNLPTREVYYGDKLISDNTPIEFARDKRIEKILNDSL